MFLKLDINTREAVLFLYFIEGTTWIPFGQTSSGRLESRTEKTGYEPAETKSKTRAGFSSISQGRAQ